MKKLLLTLLAVVAATTAILAEQPTERQHLGFEIGYNRPLLRESTAASTKLANTISMNGMKVGVVYDASIFKGFGTYLGVYYNVANTYTKWQDGAGLTKYPQTREQYLTHSIDIPVNLQYRFPIADDTYLIVYTGPSFEYAFSLRQSSYTRTFDQQITRTDKSYFDIDSDGDGKKDYSHFFVKWSVGGGFQFQNYYLRAGYEFGIKSLYSDNYNNTYDYTRHGRYDSWNIRLGIYFLNF